MKETDSLGTVEVPDSAYYGIYSQRSSALTVSPHTMAEVAPVWLKAIFSVKECCALANKEIGSLPEEEADAVIQAAREGRDGRFDSHIIVDYWQGNGHVATNMNINEILAKRANEILTGKKGYDRVQPNDHVSCNQSTTDVMSVSMRLAAHRKLRDLRNLLESMAAVFDGKAEEHGDTIRLARPVLKDSLPMTFGQTFTAYRDALARLAAQSVPVQELLLAIPMGSTAFGSGIGAERGFDEKAVSTLRLETGIPFVLSANKFDTVQNEDPLVAASNYLQTVAATVSKIAKDIRLLGSGPKAGFAEIHYTSIVPGSSIMPGKMNPVMEELLVKVSMKVIANASIAAKCLEDGELEYNPWADMIGCTLFESFTLLENACRAVSEHCFAKLEVNVEKCRAYANASSAIVVFLNPVIGYKNATKIALRCYREGLDVKDAVVQEGVMTAEDAAYFFDPLNFTSQERYFSKLEEAQQKFGRRNQ